ncbi:MAG: glycosyltransferase [Candidatus Omnitrophica bacterium]|nr:glycosyltransferase [Candidatus Omnitrophota bacterium]
MDKKANMFSLIIVFWIFTLLYFNPRLLALLVGPENIPAKFCVVVFMLSLDLFWFYAFYHLVIIIFSYFTPLEKVHPDVTSGWSLPLKADGDFQPEADPPLAEKPPSAQAVSPVRKLISNGVRELRSLTGFTKHRLVYYCNFNLPNPSPKVAVLYTTCNDFQQEALISCLKQNYKNFHVFILDDNSDEDYKNRIDNFSKIYPDRITIIRREKRIGFKAGNLNNGLRQIGKDYEYFSISDADTILPANYISRSLPFFSNKKIAFVQANQIANPQQKSIFAKLMAFNIDLHYKHYAVTKNRFGFVMFYGHGALMRIDIWRQIGGFPEIATEDLGYSMKVRQAGYEGIFLRDVICFEDFPPTYKQYRSRNEKWIRGTSECLLKYYPSFLRTKHIHWFEKFDCLVSALSLLTALPFIILLLMVGIFLPLWFVNFQFQGPMLRMPILYDKTLIRLATQLKSNLFWSWDFYIIMLITLFAPLLPVVIGLFKCPLKMLRYMTLFTFNFFSLQIVSGFNMLSYILTKKATFPITGEQRLTTNEHLKQKNLIEWLSQSNANHKGILIAEVIWAFMFWLLAVKTQNIWFFTISIGLFLSPLLFKWNLENKTMRYLTLLPFLITLVIIFLIGKNLINP